MNELPEETTAAPADTPPDRCANNPASPFYDEAALTRGIGIRFKGIERHNVDEYCVSEGWVRVSVARLSRPPRQSYHDQAVGHGGAVFPHLDGAHATRLAPYRASAKDAR